MSENIPDDTEIMNIINIIAQLNSLNHTKNTQQVILYILNIIKNKNKIYSRERINNEFFEHYGDVINIKDKLIWILYEENSNKAISEQKYKKTILEGKMTEKGKFNFGIFDSICKKKVKEDIEGKSGTLFESSLYDRKILIIEINCLKKKNIPLEKIQSKIKLLKESCPLGYNNLDTYIQIKNKIINLETSYDLFLKELKDNEIILDNNKINIEKNKITDINLSVTDNNMKILELNENELRIQLNKEKEKNKILKEKIKILERELIEEKNKTLYLKNYQIYN